MENNVNLSGTKAEDFLKWLQLISGLLPPKMSLKEAKAIFLRREEERKNEAKEQAES